MKNKNLLLLAVGIIGIFLVYKYLVSTPTTGTYIPGLLKDEPRIPYTDPATFVEHVPGEGPTTTIIDGRKYYYANPHGISYLDPTIPITPWTAGTAYLAGDIDYKEYKAIMAWG